ncbi:unnamed protein product, partial [Vitis vinifera]|uniref:Uncharacterized protein n=1 Tax=Vitis vinifera TaxID=29760 RepID=D7U3C8_VITVI
MSPLIPTPLILYHRYAPLPHHHLHHQIIFIIQENAFHSHGSPCGWSAPDCHSEVYGEPGKRENGGQIDKERALRHASHRQGFVVRYSFKGNSRRRSLSHHASHHMLPAIIFSLGAVLITVSRTQASSKCN